MNDTNVTVAAGQADLPRTRRWRQRQGVRFGVLLAAGLALMATTVATANAFVGDDSLRVRDAENAVGLVLGSGGCVTANDAAGRILAQLDARGYQDWAIERGNSAQPGGCVAAGLVASERLVVLIPVDRPEVVEAINGVAQELMSRCLGKEQATQLISSVLTGLGATNWGIRTDGPLAYPIGQEKAVRSHINAGCFVYSGSGHGSDGQPVYYLSGPGA